MKKIYCLSLLLCANAMMFACEQERPKRLKKSEEFSPTRDKNDSHRTGKFGNKSPYCKNNPNNFPNPYYADYPGSGYNGYNYRTR